MIFIIIMSVLLLTFTIYSVLTEKTDLVDYTRRIPQRKKKHYYKIIKIRNWFLHTDKYRYSDEYEEIT